MKKNEEVQLATKKDLMELRKEMATKKDILFLYTQIQEHDTRLFRMEGKLDKTVHIVQQMCDKVLKAHDNFSAESVAIKDNYNQLETRVTKIEQVIFPATQS